MNPLWLLKILGMFSGVNVKKIFAILIHYWRIFLIVVLGAIVFYQNYSGTRFIFGAQTIPYLEEKLATSENNLKVCGDGNAALTAAIDKNNTRIDEYAKLTKDLEASVATLGGELAEERGKTNTEVEVILKDPTPKTCEKAMDYMRDGIKDLKW